MTKLTDTQYARIHEAVLRELMHLVEDMGDVDVSADAIMVLIEAAIDDE